MLWMRVDRGCWRAGLEGRCVTGGRAARASPSPRGFTGPRRSLPGRQAAAARPKIFTRPRNRAPGTRNIHQLTTGLGLGSDRPCFASGSSCAIDIPYPLSASRLTRTPPSTSGRVGRKSPRLTRGQSVLYCHIMHCAQIITAYDLEVKRCFNMVHRCFIVSMFFNFWQFEFSIVKL